MRALLGASIFFTVLGSFPVNAAPVDYKQILVETISVHDQTTDFHVWDQSDKNPRNYFLNLVIDQDFNEESLCSALKELTIADLTLFFYPLSQNEVTAKLGCALQLRRDLNDFFELKKQRIHQKMQVMVMNQGGGQSAEPTPTQVHLLDPTGGPRMVYGGLPEKVLNFTFDDGPRPDTTLQVLEILNRFHLKANFFQLGQEIKKHPEITQAVAANGHFVGNHSWSHPEMNRLPYSKAISEIEDTFDELTQTIPNPVPFFRFPYGASTSRLRDYLKSHNHPDFFWSIDTLDWKYKDPEVLFEYALEQILTVGKGVILFHDVHPQTVVVLPEILEVLNQQGYKTVAYDVQR